MPGPITIAGAATGAVSVLQAVNDFKARVDAAGGAADSLISYTQPARCEPITLIDTRAQSLPYLPDVLKAQLSIYAGYYLQAVALMVGVGGVNTIKMLDQLNPVRAGSKIDQQFIVEKALDNLASSSHLFSKEAYEYGLPRLNQPFGLEAYREGLVASLEDGADDKLPRKAQTFGKDTLDHIHEVPNLAVGKMLEVRVQDKGIEGVIPVSVRLLTNLIDPATLVHILSDGVKDSSTVERYHAWRSGAISLVDMLFAVDAIDAHRSTLMHDKSGTYAEIQRRRRSNGLTTLRSGIGGVGAKVSIGTASNLVVMTEETAKELEHAGGFLFSNAAQRNRVFEQSYLMIVAVIDPEWEHVTFYHRGIALPSQLSVSAIKSASKGSGPDVAEILKAYRLGNSPSL